MTTTTSGDESVSGSGRQATRLAHNPQRPQAETLAPPPQAGTPSLRTRDYVAVLPEPIRLEINCKLRDGWRQEAIAQWLLSQTADRDIPELRLRKGDCYAALWLRRARAPEVIQVNCRTVIGRWWRGPYRDWLAQQPKPFVRPPTPKAVKIGFRALAEELKGNRKAMNLLARLNRAVRRAMRRQREEADAMAWRP